MADMTPQGAPDGFGDRGHEPMNISLRGILLFVAGLVVMAIVVHFVLGALMNRFSREERMAERGRPVLFTRDEGQFPPPRNQVAPRADLQRMRQHEATILNSYGWVDRKAGVARIPIDRAISILAERGLPKDRNTPPWGSRTRDQK